MSIDSGRFRPGIYLINNTSTYDREYIVDNELFTCGGYESVIIKVKDTLRYQTAGGSLLVKRIGNNDNVITGGYNPN